MFCNFLVRNKVFVAQLLLSVLDATDVEITEHLILVQMQAKYRRNSNSATRLMGE